MQVKNLKQIAADKIKFSQDQWFNAYRLAGELKHGSKVSILFYPNLEISLIDPAMAKELSFLLKVLQEKNYAW